MIDNVSDPDKLLQVRIRRFYLSVLGYTLTISVLWVAKAADLVLISNQQFLAAVVVYVIIEIGFYSLIRSGFSLRFKDPSLTIPQIVVALTWISYLMVFSYKISGGVMAAYYFVILFGVFQLTLTQFLLVSFITLMEFGGVILWHVQASTPNYNLKGELILWFILAGGMLWLSFVGDYIRKLREKLKTSKIKLEENHREILLQKEELDSANRKIQRSLRDLKKAQEDLIQNEKIAVTAKLVAGVAHEVNTPLGAAIMAASFLDEKTRQYTENCLQGKADQADWAAYLSKAADSSRIILENLNQAAELISSFKRLALEQPNEKPRFFNLRKNLERTIALLRAEYQQGGHTVTLDCSEQISIYSYPDAFTQIITILVRNSLVHGFENLAGREIHIQAEIVRGYLKLVYTDNGSGMDQTTLKKMFDLFFTTKKKQGRSGLGLPILNNLIHQKLEGRLECSSIKDQGVAFCIQIPLQGEWNNIIN